MPILIACPFCQTKYRLRDEHAGKWVTCKTPECRKPFQVPISGNVTAPAPEVPAAGFAPSSASVGTADQIPVGTFRPRPTVSKPEPSVQPQPTASIKEAEEAALKALADEPPPEDTPTPESQPIQMTCSSCDHVWPVDRSMEGKNVLCPECKFRQKVPIQKDSKPKDWRTAGQDKPSLARRDQEKAPEGAWDVQKTVVSLDTMAKAGALPMEMDREPTPIYITLIKGFTALAAMVGMVIVVGMLSKNEQSFAANSDLNTAVEKIQSPEAEPTKHLAWVATIYATAGEHRARTATSDTECQAALESLRSASAQLVNLPNSPEKAYIMTEVIAATALLGGDKTEVFDELKLPWDSIQSELRREFEKLRGSELDVRLEAFRRLTPVLVQRKQPLLGTKFLAFVSASDAETVECLAAIGLELLRLEQRESAEEVLKQALALAAGDGKSKPVILSRGLQAFLMAFDGEGGKRLAVPAPSSADPSLETRLGFAHGMALQGRWEDAQKLAQRPGRPDARMRAALVVAEEAIRQNAPVAAPLLEFASGLAMKELRAQPQPALLLKLARLFARKQLEPRALELVDLLKDNADQLWMRYWIAWETLQADPTSNGDWAWLEKFGAEPSYPKLLLRLQIARRQAKNGVSDIGAVVNSWESPADQAFGLAGISLGIVDRLKP
ncbi:zinc ribbon domain-containing protein [Tuwongella immobilis]|uniref:Uncharacterized protein n=1 Tax=Tuwongella immobilis TaxID=692036 RepID=A0A6C2YRZ4_9BACT|nr:hypothetical protein [Tuwongella immobilis]VIP03652.1 unnamed protein product [Tuwongella immobilis]VTS04672.1 unnamed protein product [Tuwongella immobilis]